MARASSPLWPLLKSFSRQELLQHPWRNLAALVSVMLGVALAFSVQLINASALSEFSSAVSAVGGQPDLELRATQGRFDEAVYARVATHPDVAVASPVLEVATFALNTAGQRVPLKVLGVDALVVAAVAPGVMPVPNKDADRLALFAPATEFLNPAAQQALAQPLRLQNGQTLQTAGTVAATGPALAVMDIGAAQQAFNALGQLSRIDLRLRAGVDHAAFL